MTIDDCFFKEFWVLLVPSFLQIFVILIFYYHLSLIKQVVFILVCNYGILK